MGPGRIRLSASLRNNRPQATAAGLFLKEPRDPL
jgi:hypothetical protein